MSNADKNVELVRRGYEAFNKGDMKTLTELFHENASWHTPGKSPIAGDHQGRDAAFAQFGKYACETQGTFKAKLQRILKSDDDHVVAIHHNTAERDGKKLDVDCCLVFEIKDGKVIEGKEHFFDLYAWDNFWSEPRRNT